MFRALLAIGFKIYFQIFYRLRIFGKENYIEGPALVAANHSSYFDPPLIGAAVFPKKVYFLARDSLFKFSLMRWGLNNCLALPVKRGQENASIFRLVVKLIKEGKKVAIFPEGTRSEDGKIRTPKEGIGMMVHRAQALVIPIYLHGTYEAWNCHQKYPNWFGSIAVVIGKPLDFSKLKGDKKELHQRITQEIMDKITELKGWYLSGAKGELP